MDELPEHTFFDGVSVEVRLPSPGPMFGDLFLICGTVHSRFPSTGSSAFSDLAWLQFDQVDDFFGVRTSSGEGDDVAVWLYPVVQGEVVHHHPGPFDAIRLDYCVLRNPVYRVDHYLKCIAAFSAIGVETTYSNRNINLGTPADVTSLRDDIGLVVDYWAERGVTVGSESALLVDF